MVDMSSIIMHTISWFLNVPLRTLNNRSLRNLGPFADLAGSTLILISDGSSEQPGSPLLLNDVCG